jgi:hypothetical protein
MFSAVAPAFAPARTRRAARASVSVRAGGGEKQVGSRPRFAWHRRLPPCRAPLLRPELPRRRARRGVVGGAIARCGPLLIAPLGFAFFR